MMAPATAIFVLAGLSQMAHASEQTGTLTLACKGTVISEAKREHISTSIVVNFTARTVQGFEYPGSIMITRTNEFTVDFGDSKDDMSITGIIDRVTGDVDATSFLRDPKIGKNLGMSYALKCRQTQRMFWRPPAGGV